MMSILFYLIPVMVVIIGDTEYRGPSYLQWRMNPEGLDVRWSMRDYGGMGETTMFVCVEAEAADHAWLAAQAGVFAFPADIDVTPSPAELSAFQAHLETILIPADWITPADTWRTAIRTVLGMFATAGKYAVITGESLLDAPVTLNTQLRNYPAYVADALEQIATNMGYPWQTEVKQNWTTRILLKWFADQWPGDSFPFGDMATV